jgi:acetyl-CoA acetyltransferase
VNRLCGSGFESIVQGAHRILLGEAETVLAGGMENMSQAPHVIRGARKGLRLGQGQLEDSLMVALLDSYCGLYMAQTSDRVAAKYGITRAEQDEYALVVAEARRRGVEGLPPVRGGRADRGEGRTQDAARRTRRPPAARLDARGPRGAAAVVRQGRLGHGRQRVGIVDGAAAVVVTSAEKAAAEGKKPLGRLVSWASSASSPS